MSENRHITQINNTAANLSTNLDNHQIGIQTDGSKYMVYKDGAGALHIIANQSEAMSFTTVTTQALTVNTGYTLTLTDITQGHVLFGGASGVVSGEAALFYDAANNRLGIGDNSPGRALVVYDGTDSNTIGNAIKIHLIGAVSTDYCTEVGFGYSSANYAPGIIGFQNKGNDYTKGDLYFCTRDVTTNTIATERLRITSAGVIELKGNANRTIQVGTRTSGAGYDMTVAAGASGDNNGGHLYLQAGALGGAGANGTIYVGDVNTAGVTITPDLTVSGVFNASGGFTLAGSATDYANLFKVTDATAERLSLNGLGYLSLGGVSAASTVGIFQVLRDTGTRSDSGFVSNVGPATATAGLFTRAKQHYKVADCGTLTDDSVLTVVQGQAVGGHGYQYGGMGWVTDGAGNFAVFSFFNSTVTFIQQVGTVVSTDTDNNLCILATAATASTSSLLQIRNRIGATANISYGIEFGYYNIHAE